MQAEGFTKKTMILLELNSNDLLETRFAFSPMLELVLSYRVLMHPELQSIHLHWVSEAYCATETMIFPYMDAVITPKHYITDFITPTPTTAVRNLDDAIEGLRATPEDLIRKNVRELLEFNRSTPSNVLQHFLDDPRCALEKLIAEMDVYWRTTLAHHWPRIRTVLENDVLYRARQHALQGIEVMLSDLDKKIRYQDGAIRFDKRLDEQFCHQGKAGGLGLQLVPAVFTAPYLNWQVAPEWKPMLVYSARGTGLWHQESPQLNQALTQLIGTSKARILHALAEPVNTGELAIKLAVTPGAISQHLGQLTDAGLVESHRSGNRVYYRLSPRGEGLLELFAD